jgi:hypothetical protein
VLHNKTPQRTAHAKLNRIIIKKNTVNKKPLYNEPIPIGTRRTSTTQAHNNQRILIIINTESTLSTILDNKNKPPWNKIPQYITPKRRPNSWYINRRTANNGHETTTDNPTINPL